MEGDGLAVNTYLESNTAAHGMGLVVGVQKSSSKGRDVNVASEAQVDQSQARQNVSTDAFLLMGLEPVLLKRIRERKEVSEYNKNFDWVVQR